MQKGCPKCGRIIPASHEKCPFCNYDFSELNMYFKRVEDKIIEENKYAGFVKRLIAGLIDIYIVLIMTLLIIIPLGIYNAPNIELIYKNALKNIYIIMPLYTLIYIFYNTLLERTKWHGSVGKKMVGIEVTDEYENPETLGIAFIRNLVKFLNIFTLGIGFIMSAFPQKKQTLGDKVSKTYVISLINFNEEKKFDFTGPIKRFIAFIIDEIVISIIVIGLYYLGQYLIENIQGLPEAIINAVPNVMLILSLVVSFFYFPVRESMTGQTIGKKTMKIKLTDQEGEIISFQKAFIRQFLNLIDILCLGFLLIFSNKKRQTLKDKLSKTIVIDY